MAFLPAACKPGLAPGGPIAIQEDLCRVRAGGAPGPITDPNGPFYHQVVVAQTSDGVRLSGATQVLDHASVPDGVRRADGTVLVYYVNGAQGSVWVARLEGGAAVPVGPITVDGIAAPAGVVDPDAILLADGSIRLAFLHAQGTPAGGESRAMCLAESSDGIGFTVTGSAISFDGSEQTTDPSLARLANGNWLMAISQGQRTILTRSGDGRRFEVLGYFGFGGVPELTALADGRVRLYTCFRGGIDSYLSGDGGGSWQPEATVVPQGTGGKRIICDPSFVPGAGLFVYKTGD